MSSVTVPLNFYPKTGVYFSHVWNRGSLALDPSQNKFQLRFLLRAHGKLADNEGVNLGRDWPPLARGFQISRYTHTRQATTPSYPLDNERYGPLGLDIILLFIVVDNSNFPGNIFKGELDI